MENVPSYDEWYTEQNQFCILSLNILYANIVSSVHYSVSPRCKSTTSSISASSLMKNLISVIDLVSVFLLSSSSSSSCRSTFLRRLLSVISNAVLRENDHVRTFSRTWGKINTIPQIWGVSFPTRQCEAPSTFTSYNGEVTMESLNTMCFTFKKKVSVKWRMRWLVSSLRHEAVSSTPSQPQIVQTDGVKNNLWLRGNKPFSRWSCS